MQPQPAIIVDEHDRSSLSELRDIFHQAHCRTLTLSPGEVLIRENQPSGSLFLLLRGELVISRKGKAARPKTIATLREGALLGELSFLLSTLPSVTIAARANKGAGAGGSGHGGSKWSSSVDLISQKRRDDHDVVPEPSRLTRNRTAPGGSSARPGSLLSLGAEPKRVALNVPRENGASSPPPGKPGLNRASSRVTRKSKGSIGGGLLVGFSEASCRSSGLSEKSSSLGENSAFGSEGALGASSPDGPSPAPIRGERSGKWGAVAASARTGQKNLVTAARAAAARAHLAEQAVVMVMDHSDAQRLMASDPALMLRFFRSMACNISRRVLDTTSSALIESESGSSVEDAAAQMRSSSTTASLLAIKQERRSAFEIASVFGIPVLDDADADAKLVMVIGHCSVLAEGASESRGKAFLYKGHLAIEEQPDWASARLFARRHTVALHELLGVRDMPIVEAAAGADGAVDVPKSKQQVTVELQMLGTSIRLSLDSAEGGKFSRAIEHQRLQSMANGDSSFVHHTKPTRRHSTALTANFAESALQAVAHGADTMQMPEAASATSALAAAKSEDPTLPYAPAAAPSAAPPVAAPPADGQPSQEDDRSSAPRRASTGPQGLNLRKLTAMSEDEWRVLLQGSRLQTYVKDETVRRTGNSDDLDGLLQVVHGTLRLEVAMPGRPQALVMGRIRAGDVLGEMSFLLGTPATAAAVCESESAATVRLSSAYLNSLMDANKELAGKFYAYLATRAGEKLRAATNQEDHELVMHEDRLARKTPKTVLALTKNPAFLTIFERFIHATKARDKEFGALIRFARDVFALQAEPDAAAADERVRGIHATYLDAASAMWPLGDSLAQRADHRTSGVASEESSTPTEERSAIMRQRHVYDNLLGRCLRDLEAGCLRAFLRSEHYAYVNELRQKEETDWSLNFFQVKRKLGEGGFGVVLEVVKRDCGKRYAMKVGARRGPLDL